MNIFEANIGKQCEIRAILYNSPVVISGRITEVNDDFISLKVIKYRFTNTNVWNTYYWARWNNSH